VMLDLRDGGGGFRGGPTHPVQTQAMLYIESVVLAHPDGQVHPVSWEQAGVQARDVQWDGRSAWRSPDQARQAVTRYEARANDAPVFESYPRQGSSLAGFGASRGPRNSYPSVPRPGEPGSRFNPVVRERRGASAQQAAQQANPDMITPEDIPKGPSGPGGQPRASRSAGQDQREMAKGMVTGSVRGGVAGAKVGGKAGSVVPGLGTAAGTAIGAGVGANLAQQKVARESGNRTLAFTTGMGTGGVVGGAVNAQRAAKVRDGRAEQGTAEPQAGGRSVDDDMLHFQTDSGQLISMGRDRFAKKGAPDNSRQITGEDRARILEEKRARNGSRMERLRESKVGQAVQSPEFKDGAKRVGTEVLKDAAAEAGRAKQGGASNKGVAASAAKGAISGATRGVRTEMANRKAAERQQNEKSDKATPTTGADVLKVRSSGAASGTEMVDRLGATVKSQEIEKSSQSSADQKDHPISERYDYQFETPKEAPDSQSQYGG